MPGSPQIQRVAVSAVHFVGSSVPRAALAPLAAQKLIVWTTMGSLGSSASQGHLSWSGRIDLAQGSAQVRELVRSFDLTVAGENLFEQGGS